MAHDGLVTSTVDILHRLVIRTGTVLADGYSTTVSINTDMLMSQVGDDCN